MARGRDLEPRKPEPLPWERQKGETIRAFSHFALYRDLGPQRTVSKVATATRLSEHTLKEQSAKYRWVERADAYWDWWERQERERREGERARLNRQHLQIGAALTTPALVKLQGRQAAMSAGGEPVEAIEPLNPASLDAQDVARLVKTGIEIQRLAAGLNTSQVGTNQVSGTELVQTCRDLIEIASLHVPEERLSRFMAEVEAYFEGGRRAA